MSHIENKPYVWLLQTGTSGVMKSYELHMTILLPAGVRLKTGNLEEDSAGYPDDGDGHPGDKRFKLELESLAAASGGLTIPTKAVITGVDSSGSSWEKKGVIVRVTFPGDAKPVRGKVKANYSAADTDSSGGGGASPHR